MNTYTVYFLIKDIISVEVDSDNQENAIKKAKNLVEKGMYKSKVIECVDGSTTFAGINVVDVWNELND